MIEVRSTNAAGIPVGASNNLHRYSDEQVARARALRAKGESITGIAHHLAGPHRSTVSRWLSGEIRRPAVSIRVVRVKPLLQSNRERQGRRGASTAAHTVAFTDDEIAALRHQFGDIA